MGAPGRLRRSRSAVVVACAIVLAGGCQVRTDVDLTVQRDGSGTVRVTVVLDREAAAQIPDLRTQLRTGDLRRAGWRVNGPIATADRGFRVTASKPFGRADQAGAVLAELAGREGPFRDFVVRRSHSFARTTWTARGTVDLTKGLRAFGDDRLTGLLGGQPFGRPEAELTRLAHGSVSDAAPFTVRVRLPGGTPRASIVHLGDQPLPVDAVSRQTNSSAYALAAGAVAALAGALLLLLLQARRRRRPPAPDPGMGAQQRHRYESIVETDSGRAPGSGGAPERVQLQRQPRVRPASPPSPSPSPREGPGGSSER